MERIQFNFLLETNLLCDGLFELISVHTADSTVFLFGYSHNDNLNKPIHLLRTSFKGIAAAPEFVILICSLRSEITVGDLVETLY
jgi:hypothetical protein